MVCARAETLSVVVGKVAGGGGKRTAAGVAAREQNIMFSMMASTRAMSPQPNSLSAVVSSSPSLCSTGAVASSSSSSCSSSFLQQQRYGCSSSLYHQLPYMSALRSICLQFSLYKGYSQKSSWRRSGGEAGGRERRGGFARAWSTSMSTGWKGEQSPYETLGIVRNSDEEEIKGAYRRMAKQFHPDVYDERSKELKEGETAESRFIQIQAAYELLMDSEKRQQYDIDHRINPLKASKSWMEWIVKKKKAFEQRGDMAVSVWAEQQQREMNLKARRLSQQKIDPEEERRILARQKAASILNFETTIKRHTLVLKKRDLVRKKASNESQKKLISELLAAEGLELDDDRF
jgi:hypothetical protein